MNINVLSIQTNPVTDIEMLHTSNVIQSEWRMNKKLIS